MWDEYHTAKGASIIFFRRTRGSCYFDKMSTTICATSDLHGHLPDVPECDLLLVAGDLCGPSDVHRQAAWLGHRFRRWLDEVPAKEIVGVAGNHDWIFELKPGLVPNGLRWHYLQDGGVELFGLKIYGSPWTPWFNDWAFNAPITDGPDEPFLAERFSRIPADTDILLTHGPAYGYGNRCGDGRKAGSRALLRHVERVQPKRHAFGHIHEGYGEYRIGSTRSVNVSHCTAHYKPTNPVVTFGV